MIRVTEMAKWVKHFKIYITYYVNKLTLNGCNRVAKSIPNVFWRINMVLLAKYVWP